MYDLKILPLHELPDPLPNIGTILVSNLVVAVINCPLEMIRMRLVVQSADPLRRTFNNAGQAMFPAGIGILATFNLLKSPTLLLRIVYTSLTTLFDCTQNLVLTRVLGLAKVDVTADHQLGDSNDALIWFAASLTWKTLNALLTMPLQTVMRRRYLF